MKTLTLTLALLATTLAGAQGKYQTFGLGPDTGFNRDGSYVTDINDSGQVLGWWPTNGEAYVISPRDAWTKNIVKTNGSPLFMNNAATIVGVEGPSNIPFYKVWGQTAVLFPCGRGAVYGAINTAGYIAVACQSTTTPTNPEFSGATPRITQGRRSYSLTTSGQTSS
jgi:hypothetical protein